MSLSNNSGRSMESLIKKLARDNCDLINFPTRCSFTMKIQKIYSLHTAVICVYVTLCSPLTIISGHFEKKACPLITVLNPTSLTLLLTQRQLPISVSSFIVWIFFFSFSATLNDVVPGTLKMPRMMRTS